MGSKPQNIDYGLQAERPASAGGASSQTVGASRLSPGVAGLVRLLAEIAVEQYLAELEEAALSQPAEQDGHGLRP